jgi:hypothetical protein
LGSRYAGFSAPCAPTFTAAAQHTNPAAAIRNPKLFIVSLTMLAEHAMQYDCLKIAAMPSTRL